MLVASAAVPCRAEPVPSPSPGRSGASTAGAGFDPVGQLSLGSGKDPILISADQLDFDWQNNKVVYRGKVHATQGDLVIDSDTLTINFLRPEGKAAEGGGSTGRRDAKDGASRAAATGDGGDGKAPAGEAKGPGGEGVPRRAPTLRDVVAEGHVVITQKGRRATGGIAVFSQQMRQLVLGGDPVLRDGPNEVTGDRIVVYIDEGRSVVESSGSKRVSAVLYPGSEKGLGGKAIGAEAKAEPGVKPAEKASPGGPR